jgi:hypothetical protein
MELMPGGQTVRKTRAGHAFSLASPVLHDGDASCSFKLNYKPGRFSDCLGIFPADLDIDSEIFNASGKRCALLLSGNEHGTAAIMSDGAYSHGQNRLQWQRHDQIDVSVEFDKKRSPCVAPLKVREAEGVSAAALVTFSSKGRTLTKRLENIPAGGLCFGVGIWGAGCSITLVRSGGGDLASPRLSPRGAPPARPPRASHHGGAGRGSPLRPALEHNKSWRQQELEQSLALEPSPRSGRVHGESALMHRPGAPLRAPRAIALEANNFCGKNPRESAFGTVEQDWPEPQWSLTEDDFASPRVSDWVSPQRLESGGATSISQLEAALGSYQSALPSQKAWNSAAWNHAVDPSRFGA